jgi:hypothetical protein
MNLDSVFGFLVLGQPQQGSLEAIKSESMLAGRPASRHATPTKARFEI